MCVTDRRRYAIPSPKSALPALRKTPEPLYTPLPYNMAQEGGGQVSSTDLTQVGAQRLPGHE